MGKLKVEKPTYGLYFLASTSEGKKVLIPRTAPGEIWEGIHLKENIYKPLEWNRLNFSIRRVPLCGYYPLCSGCQWQHIRPEEQVKLKKQLFEEYIGIKPFKIIVSPSERNYRIRTLLYRKNNKLGFKKAWFYDLKQPVLNIDHCPLLHPNLNKVISQLKELKFPTALHAVELLTNPRSGETFVKLLLSKKAFLEENLLEETVNHLKKTFNGIGIYIGEYLHWERLKIYGKWETTIKVGKYKLLLSPDTFVQPNHLLWEQFQKVVKPLGEYKRAVELHAGIGFFTFHLAEFVEELHSSDIGREAYLLRKKTTYINKVENVKNLHLDAYKHFKREQNVELLVVDPPRGGLTKPLLGQILKKPPKELIYISCNLESLKRDLESLKRIYRIEKGLLVEQFPNTYHVESVVWLLRT